MVSESLCCAGCKQFALRVSDLTYCVLIRHSRPAAPQKNRLCWFFSQTRADIFRTKIAVLQAVRQCRLFELRNLLDVIVVIKSFFIDIININKSIQALSHLSAVNPLYLVASGFALHEDTSPCGCIPYLIVAIYFLSLSCPHSFLYI